MLLAVIDLIAFLCLAVQFVIADRTLPAPASGRIGPEVTQGSVSLRNIHRSHSGGPAVVPYVAIDRW